MVTKEQAVNASWRDEFHALGLCQRTVGPRGGVTRRVYSYRVNGACKTWKTRPTEFRLPIKYGLRQCTYLDNVNAHHFVPASECPVCNPELHECNPGNSKEQ